MQSHPIAPRTRVERAIVALLFAATGSLIMIVFSPLRPLLEGAADYLGRVGLIALLAIATLAVRRSRRFERYWPILAGLCILAVAVSLDWIFAIYLLKHLGVDAGTPRGFALVKLNECAVIVVVVVLLTQLAGGRLGALYLQRGNLKQGLLVGLAAFLVCVAGSVPMAGLLFKGQGLTAAAIVPWIPWLLVFVLANATQEELLFRGLFLQKLQPFYGALLSNLLIAFVFTLLHRGVTYAAQDYAFAVLLFLLALAWGYVAQKTGSLWGSILFHAGTDIPVMLGIFANLS